MWTEPWRRIIIISHQVLIWTLNAHSPLRSAHLKVQPVCLNLILFIVAHVSARHFFSFAFTLRVADVFKRKNKKKRGNLCHYSCCLHIVFPHQTQVERVNNASQCHYLPLWIRSLCHIIFSHRLSQNRPSTASPPLTHRNPTQVKVPSPNHVVCCLETTFPAVVIEVVTPSVALQACKRTSLTSVKCPSQLYHLNT